MKTFTEYSFLNNCFRHLQHFFAPPRFLKCERLGRVLISYAIVVAMTYTILLAQKISGGYNSLSVCTDNTARSWGRNSYGELGNGTTTNSSSPVQVSSLTGITAVESGWGHSLSLKNDGTVWSCGYNAQGQLADGTTTNRSTAVQVISLTGITAIACGWHHSIFLKNDGTVWACGRNQYGQLGDGTIINRSTPVQVSGLTGITAVAAAVGHHSLFLKNDGTVWACGYNNLGQLGNGTTTNSSTPVQVIPSWGGSITAISGGYSHSIFLKNDGTVWTCGSNGSGQLGDGTIISRSTPVQVNSLAGITAVAGGTNFSLFLKNDGTVWACGYNGYGQLGNGTTTNSSTPVQVNSLTGITDVECGHDHSLFLKNDGTLWACGYNLYGQLGDGTTTDKWTSGQVNGLCTVIVLPVELISFSSQCTSSPNPTHQGEGSKLVKLNWATASEQNNDYFTVERSNDGISFEQIGTVKGAGNSTTTHNYEFIDSSTDLPVRQAGGGGWEGALYYRLKQADYNGKYEYFGPISVECNSENEIMILPSISDNGYFTIIGLSADANINVCNLQGEKIYSTTTKDQSYILDISNFTRGIYFVSNINNKQIWNKKIVFVK